MRDSNEAANKLHRQSSEHLWLPSFGIACYIFLPLASRAQTASDASGTFAAPNGSNLALGDSCYTITAGAEVKEHPIGYVFQSLTSDRMDGVDVLTVIVHQHLLAKKFDIRDRLVLRESDLTPLRLDTERDGALHVHLDYVSGRRDWLEDSGRRKAAD